MKLKMRAFRVFLVGAKLEILSMVMLATAARTELIQPEVLTTRTSQTVINSANDASEALQIFQRAELEQDTQPLPDAAADTSTVNTDTNISSEELQAQGNSRDAATETLPATVSAPLVTTTDTNITPEALRSEGDIGNATTNTPASTEVKILAPTPNTVLDVTAATVTLQFAGGSQVELRVNGATVDSSLIGRTETDDSTNLVTQTWYGVGLQQGENTITAQATTNGSAGQLTSVKVQVRGDVKRLKIQTVEARIPADGRSTATVQGQLLDAKGNRSNQDAVVTLAATAGSL